jgi:WD40 repeat protein
MPARWTVAAALLTLLCALPGSSLAGPSRVSFFIGRPLVEGTVAERTILDALSERMPRIERCIELALEDDEELHGWTRVKLDVEADGSQESNRGARPDLGPQSLHHCLCDAMAELREIDPGSEGGEVWVPVWIGTSAPAVLAVRDVPGLTKPWLRWGGARALSVSSLDGAVATAGGPRKVLIWKANLDGEPRVLDLRRDLFRKGGRATSLAFSPDGRLLLAGYEGGILAIWDWQKGVTVARRSGHRLGVRGVGWSPDGRTVIARSGNHALRVWNVEPWSPRRTLEFRKEKLLGAGFTGDGQWVVTAHRRVLRAYDIDTGTARVEIVHGHADLRAMAVSADADRPWAATSGAEGSMRVFDLKKGREFARLQLDTTSHPRDRSMSFVRPELSEEEGPGGTRRNEFRLATGFSGLARVVGAALAQGRPGGASLTQPSEALSFSRDGRVLACATAEAVVFLWNPRDVDDPLIRFVRHEGAGFLSVGFAPDGDALLSGDGDRRVIRWELPAAAAR